MSLQNDNTMKDKKKKKKAYATLLTTYRDPTAPGSLGEGGVARFARAQKLPIGKVRKTLERDLGYTLHKPRRRHFPTLPVMVGGRSDRSDQYCQIQSRLQVSIDSDRRVFQVRLGGTCQAQDRTRRDDCFREDFETKSRSPTVESSNGQQERILQ